MSLTQVNFALSVAVTPLLAQTWQVTDTNNFHVLYNTDDTSALSGKNDAQQECVDRYGSSLASIHTDDQLNELEIALQSIDDGSVYLFGLEAGERFEEWLGACKYQWIDGSTLNYSFLDRWDREVYQRCSNTQWLYLSTGAITIGDGTNQVFNGFVCNRADPPASSLNDPLQCHTDESGRHCVFECNSFADCYGYRNPENSLNNLQSLQMECNLPDRFACASMSLSIQNVSVLEIGSSNNERDIFMSGGLYLNKVNETTLSGRFSFLDSHWEGNELGSVRLMNSLGNNIVSIVDAQYFYAGCRGNNVCIGATLDLTNVTSTLVECHDSNVCAGSHFRVKNSSDLEMSCALDRGCTGIRLTAEHVTETVVDCRTRFPGSCENIRLDLRYISHASILCGSENGFGDTCFGTASLMRIDFLTLSCRDAAGCRRGFFADILSKNWGHARTVQVICEAANSCSEMVLDGLVIAKSARRWSFEEFSLTMICEDEWSCDFAVLNLNDTSIKSRSRVIEFDLQCRSPKSCSLLSREVSSQKMMDFAYNISSKGTVMKLLCQGSSACLNSVIQLRPSNELWLTCTRSRGCDNLSVQGFCAKKVGVEVSSNSVARELEVVCPSDSNRDRCVITVGKNGRIEGGSLAMTSDHFRKADHTLLGGEDSFESVNTAHVKSRVSRKQCLIDPDSDSTSECFLVKETRHEWRESRLCFEFSLSLYNPDSAMIMSGTCMMGSLFILGALLTHTDDTTEDHAWLYGALVSSFFSCSLTSLVCALILLGLQTHLELALAGRVPSPSEVGMGFGIMASLNVVLYSGMLSICEAWALVCSEDSVSKWLNSVIIGNKSNHRKWESLRCTILALRIAQMLLIYIIDSAAFPDGSLTQDRFATLFVCFFSVDFVILAMMSRLGKVMIMVLLPMWLVLSRFSPLSVILAGSSAAQNTYFQVLAKGFQFDGLLLWFDLLLFEMLSGLLACMLCCHGQGKSKKVYMMFVQFLDLATDMTVVSFWMIAGLYLWASIEMFWLIVCALVQWSAVRHQLTSMTDHVFMLSGMARGYTKIRLWSVKDDRWSEIDASASQLETYYESFPSLMLGMYIVTSDQWYAEQSEDRFASQDSSRELGPLLISVIITALSVGFKIVEKVNRGMNQTRDRTSTLRVSDSFSQTTNSNVLRFVIFLFAVSDFVVRALPLCLVWTAAQNDTRNTSASPSLIGALFGTVPLCLAWQWFVIGHASLPSVSSSELFHTRLYFSMPSILSCSAMFFGCFGTRGVPLIFDLRKFFLVHWMHCLVSLLLIIIILSIAASKGISLWSTFVSYFVCFAVNLLCSVILFRSSVE